MRSNNLIPSIDEATKHEVNAWIWLALAICALHVANCQINSASHGNGRPITNSIPLLVPIYSFHWSVFHAATWPGVPLYHWFWQKNFYSPLLNKDYYLSYTSWNTISCSSVIQPYTSAAMCGGTTSPTDFCMYSTIILFNILGHCACAYSSYYHNVLMFILILKLLYNRKNK